MLVGEACFQGPNGRINILLVTKNIMKKYKKQEGAGWSANYFRLFILCMSCSSDKFSLTKPSSISTFNTTPLIFGSFPGYTEAVDNSTRNNGTFSPKHGTRTGLVEH